MATATLAIPTNVQHEHSICSTKCDLVMRYIEEKRNTQIQNPIFDGKKNRSVTIRAIFADRRQKHTYENDCCSCH